MYIWLFYFFYGEFYFCFRAIVIFSVVLGLIVRTVVIDCLERLSIGTIKSGQSHIVIILILVM